MQEEDYTFVTLDSDEAMLDNAVMLSDADILDTYSTDIDGSDISFIL